MIAKDRERPSADDLRARSYEPADLESVLAVFDSNVPEFFTLPEREAFTGFLKALPGPYLVVESADGRVVACGGYAVVADDQRADLCWGMVCRSRHGEGIGRFLTRLRIDAARADLRVASVILNTSQHTRGFYEVLGFHVTKVTIDGFAPGLDRCDMQLEL